MRKMITFWVEEGLRNDFSEKYSNSMSKFFRNCMQLALEDKRFFRDVYFLDNFENVEINGITKQDSIF